MYCQKCGKQIDDGSAFCQYCGVHTGNFVSNNSVNEKVYQNYNVQHTERKTEHIKSKEEFMADYRAKHPEIIVYFVLFAICIIAGAIVFIMNFLEFSNHHREENLNGMLISVFFDVGAFAFLYAKNRSEKLAQTAYNTYLNDVNSQLDNIDRKEPIYDYNKWECPRCGQLNADSVKYCLNCSSPKVITFSKPQGDEWQCPNCGKIHKNYVGSCGCGQTKPNQ